MSKRRKLNSGDIEHINEEKDDMYDEKDDNPIFNILKIDKIHNIDDLIRIGLLYKTIEYNRKYRWTPYKRRIHSQRIYNKFADEQNELFKKVSTKGKQNPKFKPLKRKRTHLLNEYDSTDSNDTVDNDIIDNLKNIAGYNNDKYSDIDLNVLRKLYYLIPTLIKLKNMIGMTDLKQQIIQQIVFLVQDLRKDIDEGDLLHTVICGEPGCGKTEIAKIIGEIYCNLGFLSAGKFSIAKQSDLIGKYVGHTAAKTRDVLEKALGGVLFIDEVYSLSKGDGDSNSVGFSKECIDTINEFLSEHKKDIVCIIAGYAADIEKRFFALNKGLARRFPYRYSINKYKSDELVQIFRKQVADNKWLTSDNDVPKINELFKKNYNLFAFGGGDTANLFTLCKNTHGNSKRIFGRLNVNKCNLNIIDIKKAFDIFIENKSKISIKNQHYPLKSKPIPIPPKLPNKLLSEGPPPGMYN